MAATNYAKNVALNFEFRGEEITSGSYVPDGWWWVGLSLSTIDAEGNGVLEPSKKGYKRVLMGRTSTYWTVPTTSGSLSNKVNISFPQSAEHWGKIKEIFIANHSIYSGSYIWFHEPIDPPMAILDGTKITIPIASIAIDRQE